MRAAQDFDGEALGISSRDLGPVEPVEGGFGMASTFASLRQGFDKLTSQARRIARPTRASPPKMQRLHRQTMGNARDLAQAMHQAQKMAVVGQLASGIAHDFNNSLQVAMGALALSEKRLNQQRPLECQALVRDAHDALHLASTLSRRLLSLGSPRPERAVRIDVNQVIGGMQNLLRSALGGPLALSLVLDDHALQVVCVAHELENAMLNLAINARDAMSAGGRLTISSYRADLPAQRAGLLPGPYVGLDIADTGCGMEPEVAKLAFEAFFTTKPPGLGTGLGLAMVKSFVDGHGGHVEVASTPGQGTTVCIYLPAS